MRKREQRGEARRGVAASLAALPWAPRQAGDDEGQTSSRHRGRCACRLPALARHQPSPPVCLSLFLAQGEARLGLRVEGTSFVLSVYSTKLNPPHSHSDTCAGAPGTTTRSTSRRRTGTNGTTRKGTGAHRAPPGGGAQTKSHGRRAAKRGHRAATTVSGAVRGTKPTSAKTGPRPRPSSGPQTRVC